MVHGRLDSRGRTLTVDVKTGHWRKKEKGFFGEKGRQNAEVWYQETEKLERMKEGMAVGMKLVCTRRDAIKDEIHYGEN